MPLAVGAADPLVQASIGPAVGRGDSGLDGHEFAEPNARLAIAAKSRELIDAVIETLLMYDVA